MKFWTLLKTISTVLVAVLFALLSPAAVASDHKQAAAQKAVLVTGASSGIGNKIALTLADEGFYVYAGARKASDIAALTKNHNMEGIRLDVTKQQDIDAAVTHIQQAGRGLYGLVNNAGVFIYDPLIEVSEQDLSFITDVNYMGPYRVTKAFAPLIIEQRGRITTIGSIAGLFSARLFGPYGMTKHAMEAFTDALSGELGKFDVFVSIVEPGNFRSNIMKNMAKRLEAIDRGERPTRFRDEIARMASFVDTDRSHHADPQPVANAVLDFMTAEQPKRRYLVTPNQQEADFAIRRSLQKVIELNEGHAYSLDSEALKNLLEQLLAETDS